MKPSSSSISDSEDTSSSSMFSASFFSFFSRSLALWVRVIGESHFELATTLTSRASISRYSESSSQTSSENDFGQAPYIYEGKHLTVIVLKIKQPFFVTHFAIGLVLVVVLKFFAF